MGFRKMLLKTACLTAVCMLAGCQFSSPVARRAPVIDQPNLLPPQKQETLKVEWTVPQNWKALPMKKNPLYVHQQFRSPTRSTGFGVAYIHMPLPLSPKALIFFAKAEYTKKSNQGRLIGQWTDNLGRSWFEAENNKYHVRGYAITKGLDAWIIYSGYRTTQPIQPKEVELANQCANAIVPLPLLAKDSRVTMNDKR